MEHKLEQSGLYRYDEQTRSFIPFSTSDSAQRESIEAQLTRMSEKYKNDQQLHPDLKILFRSSRLYKEYFEDMLQFDLGVSRNKAQNLAEHQITIAHRVLDNLIQDGREIGAKNLYAMEILGLKFTTSDCIQKHLQQLLYLKPGARAGDGLQTPATATASSSPPTILDFRAFMTAVDKRWTSYLEARDAFIAAQHCAPSIIVKAAQEVRDQVNNCLTLIGHPCKTSEHEPEILKTAPYMRRELKAMLGNARRVIEQHVLDTQQEGSRETESLHWKVITAQNKGGQNASSSLSQVDRLRSRFGLQSGRRQIRRQASLPRRDVSRTNVEKTLAPNHCSSSNDDHQYRPNLLLHGKRKLSAEDMVLGGSGGGGESSSRNSRPKADTYRPGDCYRP